jgi:hypothetical protein
MVELSCPVALLYASTISVGGVAVTGAAIQNENPMKTARHRIPACRKNHQEVLNARGKWINQITDT